jgi:hypothetical protein
MIYTTKLVIGSNVETFEERLQAALDNFQHQNGLACEIQYAGKAHGHYSALVIGRTGS